MNNHINKTHLFITACLILLAIIVACQPRPADQIDQAFTPEAPLYRDDPCHILMVPSSGEPFAAQAYIPLDCFLAGVLFPNLVQDEPTPVEPEPFSIREMVVDWSFHLWEGGFDFDYHVEISHRSGIK